MVVHESTLKALHLCEFACRDFVKRMGMCEACSTKSYKLMKDAIERLDVARKEKR